MSKNYYVNPMQPHLAPCKHSEQKKQKKENGIFSFFNPRKFHPRIGNNPAGHVLSIIDGINQRPML